MAMNLDPKTEKFVGAGACEANDVERGKYVAPFVVPEKV
jgi:hypothetical protein